MKFKDQEITELMLNVGDDNIDLKELSILTHKKLKINEFDIDYGIIGASHFLIITNNTTGEILSEVFACIDLSDDTNNNIASFELSRTKKLDIDIGMFKYNYNANIISFDELQFLTCYDSHIMKGNSSNGLIYNFPQRENEAFDAVTTIKVEHTNKTIIIETMHAYPNNNKIATTKTKISHKEL